jgi:hypothetical protein
VTAFVLAAAYTALVVLTTAVPLGHATRIPRRRTRAHRPQEQPR